MHLRCRLAVRTRTGVGEAAGCYGRCILSETGRRRVPPAPGSAARRGGRAAGVVLACHFWLG